MKVLEVGRWSQLRLGVRDDGSLVYRCPDSKEWWTLELCRDHPAYQEALTSAMEIVYNLCTTWD